MLNISFSELRVLDLVSVSPEKVLPTSPIISKSNTGSSVDSSDGPWQWVMRINVAEWLRKLPRPVSAPSEKPLNVKNVSSGIE